MPATTPGSRRCSAGSAAAFILRPRPSRLLLGWLIATHALAAVAVLALPLGAAGKAASLVALAAHARWRRPRHSGPVVRNANGSWALPDAGLAGLELEPATCFGDWWVELRLGGAGRRLRLLICRDQLEAGAWRTLQAALRRAPDRLS